MRIVQLIYFLRSGGAEKFVVNLSNELSSMGHEVCVCMLREDNEANSFNRRFLKKEVKFVSLNIPVGFSLSKVRIVEHFLEEYRPDAVHCHLNVIPYIFRLSLKYRGSMRFIYTLHSLAQYASGSRFQVPINRFFFRSGLIRPVTISSQCDASYRSLYGLDNAAMIENGAPAVIPTDDFRKVRDEVSALCGGKEVPVFVHVARFHKLKNQNLLVDAFNRMDAEGYDFRLLVIGSGFSSGDGHSLMERACRKIIFLGEKPNVGDYLLCSDVFCLSSDYEGLPISLLEAMSCGLTPICTAAGGIPDVITDGENGYLVGEGECSAYCDGIRRFLERRIDPALVRASFEKRFSMRECAGKYITLYQTKR